MASGQNGPAGSAMPVTACTAFDEGGCHGGRTGLLMAAPLLLLLAAALGLRLYRLDSTLWIDEMVMATRYVGAPVGKILSTYDSQNQHILYTLLAHGARAVCSDRGWSLRLPAVAFGVASIGA